MIATRKRKTFVLVHRDALVTQWIERFTQFTNLDESSIARLSSSTFEEDLKKPIVIATNQTLLSILRRKRLEYLTELHNAEYGIFLADEVHTTVGAPTFSECSIHMPSKVVFGLSATPYRWDGNGDIMEHHLGEIFAEEDDEGTMKAEVTIFGLDFQIDEPKRHGWLYWEGKFQRSRYLKISYKSKNLLKICESLINKLRSDDRNLVVMAERLNLIDVLYKKLNDANSSVFTAGKSLKTLEKKTTYTTPGKMRDGVDAPWKDTLIMTSPIQNIAQVSGRVTRGKDGKKHPVIIDLVDITCEPIRNTLFSRITYYEKKGWKVRYATFLHDKVTIVDKDYFLSLLTDH